MRLSRRYIGGRYVARVTIADRGIIANRAFGKRSRERDPTIETLISGRRARRFSIRAMGLPAGLINSPRASSKKHRGLASRRAASATSSSTVPWKSHDNRADLRAAYLRAG